jgi:hypothetical protein
MGVSGEHHAPAALYHRGIYPRYPLDRKLGGPQSRLDAEARRKILWLCRGSNPGPPVLSQTLYWARPIHTEILKLILEKLIVRTWNGLNCLRKGANGGVLWWWSGTFGTGKITFELLTLHSSGAFCDWFWNCARRITQDHSVFRFAFSTFFRWHYKGVF